MTEPSWMAISADFCSAIGLGISVYVGWQAKQIKRSVLRNARIPDSARDIEKYSDELRQSLKNWPDSERLSAQALAKAEGVIVILLAKLDSDAKNEVRKSYTLIKQRTSLLRGWEKSASNIREDKYWEVYNALMRASEVLRQMHADYKKRV